MLDEPIAISGATSFVIQETQIFARFIQSLYQYTDENGDLKIFDQNYKRLKSGELMTIIDILGYDVNSASVLQLIYKDLEMQISDEPEIKTKVEQLLCEVTSLIDKEILNFEIDLEMEDMALIDLFKALRIRIEIQTDTVFERALEIIQVFKYLAKKKLLIFVNIGAYLTMEELKSFEEYTELHNIPVLLIDRYPFEGLKKQIILDEDFVILASNL